MYLHSSNFICRINKESNHIPGEEGALACVYVGMYVCVYVCSVCMYVYTHVCMSLYKLLYRLHCTMIGDRIKLPAVKYIQFPVFISLYDTHDSRITLLCRKLCLHVPKIQLLTDITGLCNPDKTPQFRFKICFDVTFSFTPRFHTGRYIFGF